MKFRNIKSGKMSAGIANQILGRIEDGSLKPGDKLPTEPELVSSFGVSRTTLREGMQRLLMINAIEIRPGSGTFVRDIKKENILKIPGLKTVRDRKRLAEVIELRKIIEAGIIELAIDKASDTDIEKLRQCIKSHEKGMVHQNLPVEGDTKFHKNLADATHNQTIVDFYDDIYLLILNSVAQIRDYKKEYKKSLEHHRKIFKAFESKDKDTAIEIMKEHLDWVKSLIN